MKCPTCNRRGLVLETRQRPDGTVRRRYECSQHHRFTTAETIQQPRCDPVATQREKPDMRKSRKPLESLVGAVGLEPTTR